MRLSLKNVGRFLNENHIDINGITVIAGENGSGKSTIGKALYCVFSSLYDIKDKVSESRINSIRLQLSRLSRHFEREDRYDVYELAKRIKENYNKEYTVQTMNEYLATYLDYYSDVEEQERAALVSYITSIMELKDEDIINHLVESKFRAKFGSQLQHVNHKNESSEIVIKIRDREIIIEDSYEKEMKVREYIPLMKDIIYLDDEFSLESNISIYRKIGRDRNTMRDKIFLEKKEKSDVVGDILSEKRYKKIIERMDQEHIGELTLNNGREFVYQEMGLDESINKENISSGTKIMVLLKQIILNGYLEDNGIIILDEPEIHLHPQWQKMLAEIIVLMQVEYDMNVLLSTHSTDFLAFIRYYSQKYEVIDKNKAYLIKSGTERNISEIIDVTDNIDEIYQMLGEPFVSVSEELM